MMRSKHVTSVKATETIAMGRRHPLQDSLVTAKGIFAWVCDITLKIFIFYLVFSLKCAPITSWFLFCPIFPRAWPLTEVGSCFAISIAPLPPPPPHQKKKATNAKENVKHTQSDLHLISELCKFAGVWLSGSFFHMRPNVSEFSKTLQLIHEGVYLHFFITNTVKELIF